MRLLAVGGKNLASLATPFELDFDVGPLAEAGLFAIVGPTGAGKSTILDALCLALYGETPRSARAGTTRVPFEEGKPLTAQDPRQIVRRHADEAYARVRFEAHGRRYLAEWAVGRAGKGASKGQLGDAKMSLTDIDSGAMLVQGKEAHVAEVVRLTGLEFDNFRRTVLLAQGEFAAFLEADARARTRLLERLTDPTGLYRRIGVRAQERGAALDEALAGLDRALAAVERLGDEQRGATIARSLELDGVIAAAHEAGEAAMSALRHWDDHAAALLREAEARAALEASEAALSELEPERRWLDALERAAEHGETYRRVMELRSEAAGARREVDSLGASFDAATREADAETERAREVASALAHHDAEWQASSAERREARKLDDRIALRADDRAKKRSELEPRAEDLRSTEAALESCLAELRALEVERTALEAWFSSHGDHAALAASRAAWHEPLKRVVERQQRLGEVATRADAARRSLEASVVTLQHAKDVALHTRAEVERREADARAAEGALELARGAYSVESERALDKEAGALEKFAELYRELSFARGALEEARHHVGEASAKEAAALAAVARAESLASQRERDAELVAAKLRVVEIEASYEDRRDELAEGKPCPLCGSESHPYAGRRGGAGELAALRARSEEGRAAYETARRDLEEAKALATALARQLAAASATEATRAERWRAVGAAWDVAERGALVLPAAEAVQDEPIALVAERERIASVRERLVVARDALVRAEKARKTADADVASARASDDLALTSQSAAQRAHDDERRACEILEAELARERASLDAEQTIVREALALVPAAAAQVASAPSDALAWFERLLGEHTAKCEERLRLELAQKPLAARADELTRRAEGLRSALAPIAEASARIQAELAELGTLRAGLVGGRDLASLEAAEREERARLDAALRLAESARAEAVERRARLDSARTEAARDLATLEARLRGMEDALLRALAALALDEAELALRLATPDDERLRVQATLAKLGESVVEKRALFAREAELVEKAQTALPSEPRERLEVARQDAAAAAAGASREQGELAHALAEDDARRERYERLSAERAALLGRDEVWASLRSVIGHNTGDTFAEFAQVLAFERLLAAANRELSRLRPRYALERLDLGAEQRSQLELVVLDHDLGSQVRPVSTLSGGEKFLVSLALALGLSTIAAHRAPIRTMFIDEGFGTLDADTLAIATAALDSLQASGTKVGVISHVASLEEQIRTRVRVEGPSGGPCRVRVEDGA